MNHSQLVYEVLLNDGSGQLSVDDCIEAWREAKSTEVDDIDRTYYMDTIGG